MSDKISKTIQQYKTLEQLQEFAAAQESIITQLSKKILKLEADLKLGPGQEINSNVLEVSNDDAEFICNIETAKLRLFSMERELTYEESKKLEIYNKVLTQINSRKKPEEKEAEKLPTDKLLTIVESKEDVAK